jgi:two-component system LytT family response regulator
MTRIHNDEPIQPEWETLLSNVQDLPTAYKTRFLVQMGETYVTVFTHEIAYFVIENKTTYAVTESAKRYPLDETLDELEDVLNPREYFRLNRQCIAHIRSIGEVHPYFHGKLRVKLKPPSDVKMIVSREKTAALKRWLDW